MTVTLYELADARAILDAWLEESEGELTPEIEALLNELEGKTNEKVERVALYVVEQLSHAKALKAEEERLAQRRRAREKAADSLKSYLHAQLDRLGVTKVEGRLCTVAVQKNPPSVVPVVALDDTDLRMLRNVAPAFVRHEESWALDRKAVLDAHKAGALPEAIQTRVQIVQTTSLRIR